MIKKEIPKNWLNSRDFFFPILSAIWPPGIWKIAKEKLVLIVVIKYVIDIFGVFGTLFSDIKEFAFKKSYIKEFGKTPKLHLSETKKTIHPKSKDDKLDDTTTKRIT